MINKTHCIADNAILCERFINVDNDSWELGNMQDWINELIKEGYVIEQSLTFTDPETKITVVSMIHKGYLE